ncbi:MAG: GTPase domain-containing protein [Spirirestis rafaelensis WJT71-NPBG6]|jgi:GTP-binding protein EngB required for normal cell division/uncharacterized protein (DUF697 family)|nr:GTPase domain-containing protein [Spirirestis rafaelensis WJT71-NPBG6]
MTSNNDFFNAFSEAYTKAPILRGQCNILVIGKSGVGKSTLINAIFGERLAEAGAGKPVTQKIQQYTRESCPVTVYDSPGLELSSSNPIRKIFFDHNTQVKKDVYQLIDVKKKLPLKEHIHVIWYCINNAGDKIEKVEEDWLKELSNKGLSVIVVLTKAFTEPNIDLLNCLRKLPVCEIIPVLAEPERIAHNYTVKAHGLENLVNKTAELLPEVAKVAFINAISSKPHKATFWLIHAYLPSAFLGSSLVPIPFIGSKISTVTVQMAMLAHISNLFELPVDSVFITTLFYAASGMSLEFGVEEILSLNSVKEILKHPLSNFTEWIDSVVKEFPAEIPVFGGAIAGSSAVVHTLIIGLAYIHVLKIYKQKQLEGKEISVSELGAMLRETIEYYAKPGWETLKLILADASGNFAQSM